MFQYHNASVKVYVLKSETVYYMNQKLYTINRMKLDSVHGGAVSWTLNVIVRGVCVGLVTSIKL